MPPGPAASWSVRFATKGCIVASLRSPSRNALICFSRYASCCPARLGQSGLTLMPLGPWHAAHTAAFASPSALDPAPKATVAQTSTPATKVAAGQQGQAKSHGGLLELMARCYPSAASGAWTSFAGRCSPRPDGQHVPKQEHESRRHHDGEDHAPLHALDEPRLGLALEERRPGRAADGAFDEGLFIAGDQQRNRHAQHPDVQQGRATTSISSRHPASRPTSRHPPANAAAPGRSRRSRWSRRLRRRPGARATPTTACRGCMATSGIGSKAEKNPPMPSQYSGVPIQK